MPPMVAALLACFLAGPHQAPPAGPPPLTVLRIAAGPSGEVRNGDFVLDEERAQFDPARDKQVVVLFQWQGQPGVHRMTAQWRSPDGASSTTSPVQYEARDRRFGAFWPLSLSATTAPGTWTIEATVDGQPGGRFTFDVVAMPGSGPAPAAKRLLSQADLFSRASAGFVLLERATAKGDRLDPAAGFAAGRGRVFTSVAAVDGADTITAVLPDGRRQPITGMLAMNRLQDWIVLAGGIEGEVSQPLVSDASVQIGDRLFSIAASTGASRVLADGTISGRAGTPATGPRLLMTFGAGSGPPGGPVFNEFGELMGITGGSLVPGASDLSDLLRFRAELHGVPIVPISLIRSALGGAVVPLAEARARGDLLPAVIGGQHVMSGGFARGIAKTQTIVPTDQRREFSVSDKQFVAFVTWSPQLRLKGALVLRLYDEANRVVVDSKPGKLDLRPGTSRLSSWTMTVPGGLGVYRADVLIDNVPIWRGFLRIVE
jgi:S1-C subfamily serine protease